MPAKNVVSIVAKFIGGAAAAEEAKKLRGGIKGIAEEGKKTDDQLGKNSKGLHAFELGLKNTDREARKAHGGMGLFSGGIKKLVGLGAGAAGIYGIKSLVDSTQELGESAMKFSRVSGVGYNTALTQSVAMKALGLSADGASKSFMYMAKNSLAAEKQERKFAEGNVVQAAAMEKKQLALKHAEEGGKAWSITQARMSLEMPKANKEIGKQAEAFNAIGIRVAEWRKLKPEQQWEQVTKGLSGVHNASLRTAYAMTILGRGGKELIPYLNNTSFSLGHMEKIAEKAFGVTGSKGAASFESIRIKSAEANIAWEGLKYTLGMKLAPVMAKVMLMFSKIAVEIQHHKGIWGELAKVIEWVVGALKSIVKWFKESKAHMELLKALVVGFVAAWVMFKALNLYAAFMEAAAGIGAMGVTLVVATGGAIALGMAAYLIITHWKEVKKFFVGLWESIVEGAKMVFNFFTKSTLGQFLMTTFVGPLPEIIKHWKAFSHIFEEIGKGLANYGVIKPINAMVDSFNWLENTAATAYNDLPFHVGTAPHMHIGHIAELAEGGVIRQPGYAIVGERGPEVMRFPASARVEPLPARSAYASGGYQPFRAGTHGGDLHVHVDLDRQTLGTAILREFRRLEARA